MMLECWNLNPAERPKFSELKVTFESMLMETASYIQFSSLTDSIYEKFAKCILDTSNSNYYVLVMLN